MTSTSAPATGRPPLWKSEGPVPLSPSSERVLVKKASHSEACGPRSRPSGCVRRAGVPMEGGEAITPNSHLLRGAVALVTQLALVAAVEKPAAAAMPRVPGSWLQSSHGLAATCTSDTTDTGVYVAQRGRTPPSGSTQSHARTAGDRRGACVPAAGAPGFHSGRESNCPWVFLFWV